ncbi:hypothetical protein PC116_g24509 [Phytophthora cactorum]|uniref:Uncharacterized protein n=1 Tax=Phytophthora cactorum TaxID=29920 RepID=A0A8T1JVH1_9STRA|nr:hypothetical protein Pcac1_g28054 [Phytophthora cactorum]KAG2799390.1 hypothetical protein PC111_g20454 [Phytophthora cactorum]KAG2799547.1 hypothetical protein PC112_g20856 [Phytophthora cactorum]KAG2834872.1 hypothetical protein PC113_g20316 [Phytophthora cactorum]KAG2879744.1 hypothetical protein PC114_g22413 [Phytophthora cactorum]
MKGKAFESNLSVNHDQPSTMGCTIRVMGSYSCTNCSGCKLQAGCSRNGDDALKAFIYWLATSIWHVSAKSLVENLDFS